jgi:selenophosphate synthetase-related protein
LFNGVTTASLDALVTAVRGHPGWTGKSAIGVVRDVLGPGDWSAGPGDDGAVVLSGTERLVVCGEVILPAFVEHDPYGAGIAAVLTNVNDVAAMGAVPLAIVDTIVADSAASRVVLDGMRYASDLYEVPIVGGHLTGHPEIRSLSAFAVGRCPGPALSATNVAPDLTLAVLACLEGKMRDDFPFFPSFEERGRDLAQDVRLLASLAESGVCVAAKDVSMAGLLGSLAMLLEPTRCGVTVDVGAIPVPDGVPLERWLICFPCYAFLVCTPSTRFAELDALAAARGLACAALGTIDATGVLALRDERGQAQTVVDLNTESVTGL